MAFEKFPSADIERSEQLLGQLLKFKTAKKFEESLRAYQGICGEVVPQGSDIFTKIKALSEERERLEEGSEGDPTLSEAKLHALILLLNQGLSEIDLLAPDPGKNG